jgi:translation initiation factor 3 subunit K
MFAQSFPNYPNSDRSRYQFNPDLYNGDIVVNILVKALTALPMPDFNLSLALLSEMRHYESASAHTKEPDPLPSLLPHLIALASLLEQCRFREFWALYRSADLEPLRENYTVECKGFNSNVRDVVVRTVKATFAKISEERLSNYLALIGKECLSCGKSQAFITKIGSELHEFVQSEGWTLKDRVVTIPPNSDNQIEATIVRESIQLPRMCCNLHLTSSRTNGRIRT